MTSVHAGYDPIGDTCKGHAQPGTVKLSQAIRETWPAASLGVYNCRTQHGSNNLSAHGEGRAYDHAWHDEETGRRIAAKLVVANAAVGLQVVIWWDRIWSFTRGWHEYTGVDNHHGHLHVEQNWSGAWFLQYPDALAALGTPAPPPQQEDDYMLPRVMHWNGAIFLVGYNEQTGQPWRRTFPNPSRLGQVVGGGGCVTDHGNAFEVTNNQFEQVYADLGAA